MSGARIRVTLVLAPPRSAGYGSRWPVSQKWPGQDWRCKYCDRERSASEPIWTWSPLGRGCTACAFRLDALAIDWEAPDALAPATCDDAGAAGEGE